jgi:hypothetical protein
MARIGRAHNPEVTGSNPVPATKETAGQALCIASVGVRGWRNFYRLSTKGAHVGFSE